MVATNTIWLRVQSKDFLHVQSSVRLACDLSLDGLTIGVTTCYQLPGAIRTFCGSWFHVAPAVQLALALHGVKVHTVHQHLVAIPTTQSSRTPSIYTIFPELRALRRKHSQEEPADFELSLSLSRWSCSHGANCYCYVLVCLPLQLRHGVPDRIFRGILVLQPQEELRSGEATEPPG